MPKPSALDLEIERLSAGQPFTFDPVSEELVPFDDSEDEDEKPKSKKKKATVPKKVSSIVEELKNENMNINFGFRVAKKRRDKRGVKGFRFEGKIPFFDNIMI